MFEALFGRSKAKPAQLDSLFQIPSAAITLETAAGFTATGEGAVCFRAAAGAAMTDTVQEAIALIHDSSDAPEVTQTVDEFGFTWLSVHGEPGDLSELCTDLHAVNTSLEEQGFGSGLLCSLVPFADAAGRRFGLVYLYKRGTFYPFAPTGPRTRDNLLEIQIRDQLTGELPIEADLSRWMALWGAPGL